MKSLVLAYCFCFTFSVVFAQTAEESLALGLRYAEHGNYRKALKAYNKAIAYNPSMAEAYYHRGEVHYEMRDYQAMIADNKEAIRIKPDYQNAYFHLGIAYYRLGEYTKAIEELSTLIALKPQDAEAYYWRGMVYQKAKQDKKACEDWQKAQDLGNGLATPMLHKYCEEENAVETGN
jgi:tetratricopeptide (TPR) repeat protein